MAKIASDTTEDRIHWLIRTIPANKKDPHGRVNVAACIGKENVDPLRIGRSRTLADPAALNWAYDQVPELVVIRRSREQGVSAELTPDADEPEYDEPDTPFILFDAHGTEEITVSKTRRRKGAAETRKRTLARYGECCALCTEAGRKVDAAHIVARNAGGTDDERNRLPLCNPHHALFDCGIISFTDDGQVLWSVFGTRDDLGHLPRLPAAEALREHRRYWEVTA